MRCQQEKRSMERDSRAALSLARSMDQYGNSDTIFYKKKVKELSDRLQEQQVLCLEQKGELDKMRRYVERGMSQNQREIYRNNRML